MLPPAAKCAPNSLLGHAAAPRALPTLWSRTPRPGLEWTAVDRRLAVHGCLRVRRFAARDPGAFPDGHCGPLILQFVSSGDSPCGPKESRKSGSLWSMIDQYTNHCSISSQQLVGRLDRLQSGHFYIGKAGHLLVWFDIHGYGQAFPSLSHASLKPAQVMREPKR